MLANKLSYLNFTNKTIFSSIKIVATSRQGDYLSKRKFCTAKDPQSELRDNWLPIYRFPKIRTVSALNKLKNYQLAATVVGLPITYFIYPEHLFAVGYTGTTLVITLSFISYLLRNSIGFIYVNKSDQNVVRIAYLNFWGSRRDSQFHVNDIMPFSELPKSFTNQFYTTLKFNNGHEDLKLLSRDVEILDAERYSRIFE